MNAKKMPRRLGRPKTRAAASTEALAGLDPASCNPRRVLQTIALDASAPPTARVQACRALLALERDASRSPPDVGLSEVAERAVALMTAGRDRAH